MAERISVEVAYARPEEQPVIPLEVDPGSTLQYAIEQSGLLQRFPEIDLATAKVGVFGKLAAELLIVCIAFGHDLQSPFRGLGCLNTLVQA